VFFNKNKHDIYAFKKKRLYDTSIKSNDYQGADNNLTVNTLVGKMSYQEVLICTNEP
jgi:hypothetical protein